MSVTDGHQSYWIIDKTLIECFLYYLYKTNDYNNYN